MDPGTADIINVAAAVLRNAGGISNAAQNLTGSTQSLTQSFRTASYDPDSNYIPLGVQQAVNFNHILQTGDATTDTGKFSAYDNKTVDLNGNDAYAQAQRQINADVIGRIKADTACQALLQKESWTRDDRAQWERQVAQHAAEARYAVPGLADYRSDSAGQALQHSASLNADLSPDINAARTNPSARPVHELDCKDMSIIEGMAIQNAENQLLKGKFSPDNLKAPGNYFLMQGEVSHKAGSVGGHDYIYTPLGNVVEATENPANGVNYKQALVQQPWDAAFKGQKIATDDNAAIGIYGASDNDDAFNAARQSVSPAALAQAEARMPTLSVKLAANLNQAFAIQPEKTQPAQTPVPPAPAPPVQYASAPPTPSAPSSETAITQETLRQIFATSPPAAAGAAAPPAVQTLTGSDLKDAIGRPLMLKDPANPDASPKPAIQAAPGAEKLDLAVRAYLGVNAPEPTVSSIPLPAAPNLR